VPLSVIAAMSPGPGTPANAQFAAELKLPPAELFHRIFRSPLLRSSDRVSQHRVAVPRALPTPPAPPPLSPAAAGLPETGMLSIASLSIEIVSETIDGLAA
jgi:hypothetical protein